MIFKTAYMKKIFFLFLMLAIVQKNYSQSLHKQKHKKIKTEYKTVLKDTCQNAQSYSIFHSSNEINKRIESGFSINPLFICPVSDDVYRKIISWTLKGFQIP